MLTLLLTLSEGLKMSICKELHAAAIEACKHPAHEKDHRVARVGCVIRRKDGAIVKARNAATHRSENDPCIIATGHVADRHAEARATRKADAGGIAYVARVKRDGTYGNARPCATCRIIMRSKGIVKAYYTLSDREWGCIELK